MANPGQLSFRRILLSRFLLLSVPVLVMGVYITYRKARTATLDTARQNLTESAIVQSQQIDQSITSLQTNLVIASETESLKSMTPEQAESRIQQLIPHLASSVSPLQCVQLILLETNEILTSTCHSQSLGEVETALWSNQKGSEWLDSSQVQITPGLSSIGNNLETNQLPLVFHTPIYDLQQQLRYVLRVQASLLQQPLNPHHTSYPVVMDQEGTILAHSQGEKIGKNLREIEPLERADSFLNHTRYFKSDFFHLYGLGVAGNQSLTGYSVLKNPFKSQEENQWIVLIATPLDNIFVDLRKIQQILALLTFTLILMIVMAVLVIARELALPLEKLRDYALHQTQSNITNPVPQNFKIRECNQLAIALNGMVKRLQSWAEELELAWQEAQTANQLKSEFLTNISHNLRTPLNGIIGSIRLIRDGYCDDKEEEREFLDQADESAVHLLEIINNILDIAKLEAGKLTVSLEKVDLTLLLNDVIALQTLPIQEKGLTLNAPDPELKIYIYADPAKLKQVFINVFDNAIKFTETGSITIDYRFDVPPQDPSIQLQPESESALNSILGKQVIISITDTGIGIEDNARQDKLFHPFVMLDGSTTQTFAGMGLGLAISKNLIEMMEGTISLSSPGKNQGTTLEIRLPIISVYTEIPETTGKN